MRSVTQNIFYSALKKKIVLDIAKHIIMLSLIRNLTNQIVFFQQIITKIIIIILHKTLSIKYENLETP